MKITLVNGLFLEPPRNLVTLFLCFDIGYCWRFRRLFM